MNSTNRSEPIRRDSLYKKPEKLPVPDSLSRPDTSIFTKHQLPSWHQSPSISGNTHNTTTRWNRSVVVQIICRPAMDEIDETSLARVKMAGEPGQAAQTQRPIYRCDVESKMPPKIPRVPTI